MRQIVVPGDLLTTERKKLGENVYFENNAVYSSVLGILASNETSVSVIALNGVYVPQIGDGILALVKSENSLGYALELNSVTDSFIPKSILTKPLKIGTVLFVRIKNINSNDSIELDNINVLPDGNIIKVSSVKVPRLIGKNDSMLNILKNYTECNIVIGKNGFIWYSGKSTQLLEKAINLIINNSQKSNLTDSIQGYLEKEKQNTK
ncbi:MAG: KH domain-containing protein [archaeon]